MKRIILASIGLLAIGALPATAADLGVPAPAPVPVYKAPPAPAYFDWNGFYVGVNGGYSFGSASTSVAGLAPGGFGVPVNFGVNPSGWLGGGQIGYNWQAAGSPWVFGLEADFQASSETNDPSCGAPVCVPVADVSVAYPYFGTVRGRIGWDPSQWLFYVTGGLAYAEINRGVHQLGVVSYQDSQWRVGWTVGGGVEYALTRNWSIKAEYLYINYGSDSVAIAATGPLGIAPLGPISIASTFMDNIVRAGINYRF